MIIVSAFVLACIVAVISRVLMRKAFGYFIDYAFRVLAAVGIDTNDSIVKSTVRKWQRQDTLVILCVTAIPIVNIITAVTAFLVFRSLFKDA